MKYEIIENIQRFLTAQNTLIIFWCHADARGPRCLYDVKANQKMHI